LLDKDGNSISGYEIEIVNDELIITDPKTNILEYKLQNGKPLSKEIQRLQKTLFHEKQIIIENCLFGVDINPNSVKICRLRLWIELLKNAYYKEES
jgi:adenine-specific DNA-methyltransferase